MTWPFTDPYAGEVSLGLEEPQHPNLSMTLHLDPRSPTPSHFPDPDLSSPHTSTASGPRPAHTAISRAAT